MESLSQSSSHADVNPRGSAQPGDVSASFYERGYAVVPRVFPDAEIVALKAATERVRQWGLEAGSSFRQGNLGYWIADDCRIGTHVIGMQWPSYREPVLEAVRRDSRMLRLIEPLIGTNVRQIVNQLHWKTPGSTFAVNFHRDRDNRRPASAYRDLANSYVQTATAIDPMTECNGALLVVPGSHRREGRTVGDTPRQRNFTSGEISREYLAAEGYREADLVRIEAGPGDVVLWHVDTIHGSEMNEDSIDRCLYINGYVDARNSMRGHWAFIEGQGIPLPPIDVPVLIHRDDIFDHLQREPAPANMRLAD